MFRGITLVLAFGCALLGATLGVNVGLNVGVNVANARVVDSKDAAEALKRGEIIPLSDILAMVKTQYEGRMLDVRLEDGSRGLQGWVYVIRMLDENGSILLLKMDAKTASVLAVGQGK